MSDQKENTGYDFLDMPDDQFANEYLGGGQSGDGLLNEVVGMGVDGDPAKAEKALSLSKRYDLPQEEAAKALPVLERKAKIDDIDPDGISKNYPALAAAMRANPKLAEIFIPKMEDMKAMEDTVKNGALKNAVANTGKRAATLVGNTIGFADTVSNAVEEGLAAIGMGLGEITYRRPKNLMEELTFANWGYRSGAEVKAMKEDGTYPERLSQTAEKSLNEQDFGYIPQNTWETTKKEFKEGGALSASAWGELLQYSFESAGASVADMVGMVYAMPAYIASRTQEMGEERAKNKGMTEATPQELVEAAPFVVGSVLLDKLALNKILGVGKGAAEDIGKEAMQHVVKKAAKAGAAAVGAEMTTEFIQEGFIEYIGEKYGTDAKMSLAEAVDRGIGGAVAAGPMSATLSTGAAAINIAAEKRQASYLEGAVEEINKNISDQAYLDQLTEQSQKLQDATPEVRDALFQQMRESYPDMPDEVYIDPRDLQEAIQEGEYSLQDEFLVDVMNRVDGSSFDDIAISLEEYLTLGFAVDENIRSNVRLSADGLSLNDIENEPKAKDNIITRMTEEAELNIEERQEADSIYQEIESQLRATGKFTPTEAKLQAQLYPAYIATKAARSEQDYGVKLSVSELWDKMSFGGVTAADMRRNVASEKVLTQAKAEGYQGSDRGEATEWVAAMEKFGPEGMTQEARMQRAKDMGFNVDVPVYHGTASDFSAFEESEQGKVTGSESAKNAIFFSDDEATAKAYSIYAAEDAPVKEAMRKADEAEARNDWDAYDEHLAEAERLEGETFELRKNAKVLNTYLKIESPLVVDAEGMTPQDLSDNDNDNVDSWLSNQIQAAKDGGHDGLIMQNLDDAVGLYDQPSNHYVVFDPSQIRSTNAAFDPDHKDSANLLAQTSNDQTQSDEFKAWAGGDIEILEDTDIGEADYSGDGPYVFKAYHGTTHDFDVFDSKDGGNKEGYFGAVNYFSSSKYDSETNYANEGKVLESRIEKRKNELSYYYDTEEQAYEAARSELIGGSGKVIPVYVRTEKPFIVGEGAPTTNIINMNSLQELALEMVADNNDIDVEEVTENLSLYQGELDEAIFEVNADKDNYLLTAVRVVSEYYEFDHSEVLSGVYKEIDGEVDTSKLESILRKELEKADIEDPETGGPASRQVLADIIQELGYDSIIFKNADVEFDAMDMKKSTTHIHVFDENNTNIKSATDNTGAFDPNNPSILNQDKDQNNSEMSVSELQDDLLSRYDLEKLSLSERAGALFLSSIVTKDTNTGVGTNVMNEVIAYADSVGKRIELTPAEKGDYAGKTKSKAKLVKFYKKFGFVENKGKNKDYEISESMYREPVASKLNQDSQNQGSFDLNSRVINLAKASNRSTFIHESSHLFTEFEKQLAMEYGPTDDNIAMLNHAGLESFAQLDINTEEGVEAYEKLAQTFEQYAMEGKAPSPSLRKAFRAFKEWLLIIYKRLVSNRVTINNDIRQVFDRMLAVDEEIKLANAQFGYEHDSPASAKAKETLEQKLLREYTRKSEKWWKNEIAIQQKLITDDLAEERVYKAYEFIADNKLDEQQVGEILGYKVKPQTKELDPENDSLVVAIGKLGGVDRQEAEAQGIDPANWKGKANVNTSYGVGMSPFRKKGQTFDDMATNLNQYGYLDTEGMPLDPNSLLYLIDEELAGSNHYSTAYVPEYDDEAAYPVKPKRLYGTTTKGGLDPEFVALTLGYPSADVMLKEIAESDPIAVAASEAANLTMIDKYGDILNDGTLEQMAIDAVHNPERGKLLLAELKASDKKKASGVNTEMLVSSANAIIDGMVVANIRPAQYLRKEKKASIEHARLKDLGDKEGATQAKLDQLINFYLYKAATKAKTDAEKWRKYSQAAKTREYKANQVDTEYINYMKVYASLFDLKKKPTKLEKEEKIQQMVSLSKWIQAQQETNPEGYSPQFIDDNLTRLSDPSYDVSNVNLKSWNELTVSELRAVKDQLKHFRFIGGKLSEDAKLEREEITNQLQESTLKSGSKKVRPKEGRGAIGKTVSWIHENQLGIRNHVDQLDGDGLFGSGPWFNHFYKPYVLDPTNKWVKLQAELVEKVADILGPTSSEMGYEDTLINKAKQKAGANIGLRTVKTAHGDWTLMRRERIMFGLYYGSPETRETLLQSGGVPQVMDKVNDKGEVEYDLSFGHPVTENEAQEMLNHLNAEDVKIITDIWALNEELRPEAFKTQRAIAGVVPVAVDHLPFSVNGEQLTGGYMRTYYEQVGSEIKDDLDMAAESIRMTGMSGTKSGALIERTKNGGKRISYDMNNITRALSEQAQFIAYAEPSAEASRLLNNKKVTQAIVDRYGKSKLEAIRNSARGVYLGADAMSADGNAHLAKWLSTWRQNLSISALGYSPKNIIQQPVAATQIISDVGLSAYLGAIGNFASDSAKWSEYVDSRDPKVAFRMKAMDREVSENSARLGRSATNNAFQENAYIFQTMIDKAMGYPAWVAYHKRGLEMYADLNLTADEIDQRATDYASEKLADSLGSGLMKDLAPLFSGMAAKNDAFSREGLKFMTAFGSFFNTTYRKSSTAVREYEPTFEGRLKFAREYMWLLFIPAILGAIVVDDLPEDEGSWSQWMLETQAKYTTAAIMFVRNISGLAISGFSGKSQDAAAVKSVVDLVTLPTDLLTGEESITDPTAWTGAIKAFSVLKPLPGAGSLDRAAQGLQDDTQGIYAGIIEGKEYQNNDF